MTAVEEVWSAHCNNTSLLKQYADAMHQLATDVWANQGRETRLDWCHSTCREYFCGGGLHKVLLKDVRRKLSKRRSQLSRL